MRELLCRIVSTDREQNNYMKQGRELMGKDNNLSEKTAFLRIMMIIASSDGMLSDDEMQLFYKQGKELRVPPEEVQTIRESITIGEDMNVYLLEL